MSDVDPTNDNAIHPLVADLLTASLTQTQRLTTSVVDQLGTRLAERKLSPAEMLGEG